MKLMVPTNSTWQKSELSASPVVGILGLFPHFVPVDDFLHREKTNHVLSSYYAVRMPVTEMWLWSIVMM